MKNKFTRSALLMASSSLLAAFSATAANTFYNAGDLMLTFQKVGGDTVYADLGNAASLYRGAAAGAADGTNSINFMDLNTTLTSAFGSGWANDPTVYVGLAGVYSASTGSGLDSNNDPFRTLYISSSRNDVGTVGLVNSAARNIATGTNGTSAASAILSQNDILGNSYTDVAQTVSLASASGIDDKNPLTVFQGTVSQGTAYSVFAGGVQQAGTFGTFGTFGDAGEVEFALDLYRITTRGTGGTATSAPVVGQVEGIVRTGSYEGTVTVNGSGMVSFVAVPEPSSLALSGLAAAALVLRRRRSA